MNKIGTLLLCFFFSFVVFTISEVWSIWVISEIKLEALPTQFTSFHVVCKSGGISGWKLDRIRIFFSCLLETLWDGRSLYYKLIVMFFFAFLFLLLLWSSYLQKGSRLLGPISRLKDAIVGGHRRGSLVRGSSSNDS